MVVVSGVLVVVSGVSGGRPPRRSPMAPPPVVRCSNQQPSLHRYFTFGRGLWFCLLRPFYISNGLPRGASTSDPP
jgi:hypothetical protein